MAQKKWTPKHAKNAFFCCPYHSLQNHYTHEIIIFELFRGLHYSFRGAVRLLSGPSLGVFGSYYLVQVGFLEVIIWSKFVFLANKNSGFKRLVLHTQLSFVFFFVPNYPTIF